MHRGTPVCRRSFKGGVLTCWGKGGFPNWGICSKEMTTAGASILVLITSMCCSRPFQLVVTWHLPLHKANRNRGRTHWCCHMALGSPFHGEHRRGEEGRIGSCHVNVTEEEARCRELFEATTQECSWNSSIESASPWMVGRG